MAKRDRLEVIHDILTIIKNNKNAIKPTPLLRFSNLSFSSFASYEQELLDKDLVETFEDKKSKKHYRLTDRGFAYLDKYRAIKSFISEFDL